MKYVSFDIETTGLAASHCEVIQIAAVVDDLTTPIEELPHFVAFIDHKNISFEPYALNMHMKSGLLQRWLDDKNKKGLSATFGELNSFLDKHYPAGQKKRNFAGKNLQGFDFPFIKLASARGYLDANFYVDSYQVGGTKPASEENKFLDMVSHRVIDPGTSFTDFEMDIVVPGLDECKRRAGIVACGVTHDALQDAFDVVQVVRHIAQKSKKGVR